MADKFEHRHVVGETDPHQIKRFLEEIERQERQRAEALRTARRAGGGR